MQQDRQQRASVARKLLVRKLLVIEISTDKSGQPRSKNWILHKINATAVDLENGFELHNVS